MSTNSAQPSAKTCFVIGPIGNRFAPSGSEDRLRYEAAIEVWEAVIQEAVDAVGMTAVRADSIAIPGEITEQIFRQVKNADVVIADVSDANPNVMYELGLRHATGKLTVQLGEYGRLPFDVASIRTIQFVRTPAGLVDARKRLVAALAAGMDNEADLSTAQRIFAGVAVPQSPIDREMEETTDEPGFMDLLADMELAMPLVNDHILGVGAAIEEIGKLSRQGTDSLNESASKGGTAADRLTIVARFASALEPHARRIEDLASSYEDDLRRLDGGINFMLLRAELDPDARAQIGTLPSSLIELWSKAEEAMSQALELAAIVEGTGHAAKPLRSPTRRLAQALRRVASASRLMESWAGRATKLQAGG